MEKIFLIKIKGTGHYSNCFYKSFEEAYSVLLSDIELKHRHQYEIVEIKRYYEHRKVN